MEKNANALSLTLSPPLVCQTHILVRLKTATERERERGEREEKTYLPSTFSAVSLFSPLNLCFFLCVLCPCFVSPLDGGSFCKRNLLVHRLFPVSDDHLYVIYVLKTYFQSQQRGSALVCWVPRSFSGTLFPHIHINREENKTASSHSVSIPLFFFLCSGVSQPASWYSI